jgi:hypothetical protein
MLKALVSYPGQSGKQCCCVEHARIRKKNQPRRHEGLQKEENKHITYGNLELLLRLALKFCSLNLIFFHEVRGALHAFVVKLFSLFWLARRLPSMHQFLVSARPV